MSPIAVKLMRAIPRNLPKVAGVARMYAAGAYLRAHSAPARNVALSPVPQPQRFPWKQGPWMTEAGEVGDDVVKVVDLLTGIVVPPLFQRPFGPASSLGDLLTELKGVLADYISAFLLSVDEADQLACEALDALPALLKTLEADLTALAPEFRSRSPEELMEDEGLQVLMLHRMARYLRAVGVPNLPEEVARVAFLQVDAYVHPSVAIARVATAGGVVQVEYAGGRVKRLVPGTIIGLAPMGDQLAEGIWESRAAVSAAAPVPVPSYDSWDPCI